MVMMQAMQSVVPLFWGVQFSM